MTPYVSDLYPVEALKHVDVYSTEPHDNANFAPASKSIFHLKNIKLNDMWETPINEYEYALSKYNVLPQIDVCSTKHAKKCKKYFSRKEDGLKQEWDEDFFMNPPYSEVNKWVSYAYEQSKKHNVTGLLLTFAKTDTKWFNKYVYDKNKDEWLAEFKPIDHRIKFRVDGELPKRCRSCQKNYYGYPDKKCQSCGTRLNENSAPYPSCWIIFRGSEKK